MDTTVHLKDGAEVLIRPMRKDDLEASLAFFQNLPEEDRQYLRGDATRRYVVERRIREMDSDRVKRLVALVNDEIVADGAIELAGHEWTAHVGEMRLIVARRYQRRGLGLLMARELYTLAASAKVEQIVASIMRPQVGALCICQKLGFHEEAVLPGRARDIHGQPQDIILMCCDLEAAWRELESFIADSDWQRTR